MSGVFEPTDAARGPLPDRPTGDVSAAASNADMAAKILAMPCSAYAEGGYVLRVAHIRGRRSGTVHRVPLAVITHTGVHYLISPDRHRPWALNLLAHPDCEIQSSAGAESVTAVLSQEGDAVAALRLYLGELGWAKDQFPFTEDDDDGVIGARLDLVAVFKLRPRTQ